MAGLTGEPVVAVTNDPLPQADEMVIGHGEGRVSPIHEPGQTQHGRDPATPPPCEGTPVVSDISDISVTVRALESRTPGEGVRVLRQEGAALANLRLVGDRLGCC